MRLELTKQLIAILYCLFVITSCGYSPEASTPQAISIQTISPTNVVVVTSSPTLFPTSSHTPAPTASSTPEAPQIKFTTREQLTTITSLDDFSQVSLEEFAQLTQAKARQEINYDDNTISVVFGAYDDEQAGGMGGEFDYNLFFQQAVNVQFQQDGSKYTVLMFKVVTKGSDGHNTLIPINFSFFIGPVGGETIERQARYIQNVGEYPGVDFGLLTHSDTFYSYAPALYEPLIGDNPIRFELQHGGGLIPQDIGNVLLWVKRVGYFFYTTKP